MTSGATTAVSIGWIGRSVDSQTLADARRLAAVLAMTLLVDEPGKVMAQTTDGDVIEFWTPSEEAPSPMLWGQDTIVGLLVGDLDATVAALAEAGFPPISAPHSDGPVRFRHVRGPGGVAYGLLERVTPTPEAVAP